MRFGRQGEKCPTEQIRYKMWVNGDSIEIYAIE